MSKHSLPSTTNTPKPVEPLPEFPGYVSRRVDVRLPPLHRNILHAKLRELQDNGAKLKDGALVTDKTKAVLWILENCVR
jgi:hypothetical protein